MAREDSKYIKSNIFHSHGLQLIRGAAVPLHDRRLEALLLPGVRGVKGAPVGQGLGEDLAEQIPALLLCRPPGFWHPGCPCGI